MLIVDIVLTGLCLALAIHDGYLTARVRRLEKMLRMTYTPSRKKTKSST